MFLKDGKDDKSDDRIDFSYNVWTPENWNHLYNNPKSNFSAEDPNGGFRNGVAAPQIDVPLRVIVIDLSVGEDPSQLIKLVNPEIVEKEGEQREEEGCLSVPKYYGTPMRPARVTVKGLDLEGRERVHTATELLARAFCHEIDHIDGMLFVDRLTPLKRDLLKRKLRKKVRNDGWDEDE